MGLPKLPCSTRVGVRPPPEISPGAWSPGTELSAVAVWGGETGRPEQCCQSHCMLSKHCLGSELEQRNTAKVYMPSVLQEAKCEHAIALSMFLFPAEVFVPADAEPTLKKGALSDPEESLSSSSVTVQANEGIMRKGILGKR